MSDKNIAGVGNARRFVANEKTGKNASDTILFFKELIALLCGALLIFAFLFRVVVVSGPSMNATLLNGDYIILLSNTFYKDPKAGDVIVASKHSFDDGEPIIKRVIATEGQQVDIDFENGIVYVDGNAIKEPYINAPTNLYEGVSFPLTVEEGCLFVMGDNRNKSKDSRSPDIGLIDRREVIGKALFLVFPGKENVESTRDFGRIGGIN